MSSKKRQVTRASKTADPKNRRAIRDLAPADAKAVRAGAVKTAEISIVKKVNTSTAGLYQ